MHVNVLSTLLLAMAASCFQLRAFSGDEEETVIVRRSADKDRNITYNPNCDSKWTAINPQHTMCMVDKGVEVVLDQATKDAVVDQHNQLRAGVTPFAADMAKVIWDEDIAIVAGKWARQCVLGHDGARGVPSLPGIYVGQNGGFGYDSVAESVSSWYNEVKDFAFGIGSKNGGVVGHYTQVVTAATQRIGCGQAYCEGYPYGTYIFCNYAYGQASWSIPYRKSTQSCEDCPHKCDVSGKLCDCTGKMCFNGGKLDLKTCQCSCQGPLYSGHTCQTLTCPARDSWVCGPGNQWPPEFCKKYVNVPFSCPFMCGVCQHQCGDKRCLNGGTMNYQTCQCTCKSDFGGDSCQSAVCGGKKCENGGTLDKTACTCSCKSLYKGDICETLNCPEKDAWYCTQWPSNYCTAYSNVPGECPYMCDICP